MSSYKQGLRIAHTLSSSGGVQQPFLCRAHSDGIGMRWWWKTRENDSTWVKMIDNNDGWGLPSRTASCDDAVFHYL